MAQRILDREQRVRERCVSIWRVLLPLAKENARCIPYSNLADAIGVTLNEIRKPTYLRRIHYFCNRLGLPPLDVLVVTEASWAPSRGYRALRQAESGEHYPGDDDVVCIDRQRIKDEDWLKAPAEPEAESFGL